MTSSILNFYARLYKNSGKIALGLGSFLLVKNSIVHLFPKHFCLGRNGSLDVDMDEMGNTIKLYMRVCEDTGFPLQSVRPFVAEAIEPCSAGFTAFGASHSVVGVPRTFYCDYVHEVSDISIIKRMRMHQLRISNLEDVEETPTEIAMMKALLISENAQKFALARHLMYLKGNWALYEAITPSVFVLLGYLGTKYFPAIIFRSRGVNLPVLFGFSMLSILGAWVLCKITKSSLNYKMCQKLDENVTAISKDYAQGAVDFYTSLLNFNKALRELLGKRGKKNYTVYGNCQDGAIIHKFGPPFTERKDKYEHVNKVISIIFLMFDLSTFLSEPVQRIVLLEQEINTPADNNLTANETIQSFKNNVVKLNLETADDFLNGLKLLLPHAKGEYLQFYNDTTTHASISSCYNKLFTWLNMHSTTFEKGLFYGVFTPTTDEWDEQILLAILKLTSCIEQALRDICYCQGVKCPMLMKDILKMPLLVELFGEFHMKILQVLMGGPLGLNIRNLSWHGFLSPKEIPKNFFFLLLRTSEDMASHFLESSMKTSSPKLQYSISSGHLLALQYFKDTELPPQSDFLELLQCSNFVPTIMIPHFQFFMKLYQAKMFGDCIIMLLPLFEHILRCLFAHCNNCPNRVVTAESSEFYLTLDTILLQNFDNSNENKAIQYLRVGYVEFLYDFFSIQDGIRIRDRISHGQRDANSYPSNIVDVLLLATVFAAHPKTNKKCCLKESLKLQIEKIQQTFDNYYSNFHQFSIVQSLCKTWFEKMEMIISSEILKQCENQKVRNDIEDELNLNGIRNRNEINKHLSTKIRTLFQGTKGSLLLSTILKQICQSCLKTVDNFLTFLEVRNLQIKEKKLRSRQRTNFIKFLEILPKLLAMQFSLLEVLVNFVFVEFKKDDFVYNKRKEWKNLLKICENLVSMTSMSKNKWDEASLLVKQGIDIMLTFK